MEKLNNNWLTEGLIDFEYKKYMLLAYLQTTSKRFDEKKLYPFLSDLIFHYNNLVTIKNNKELLYDNFPKELSKADFKKLTLSYKKIVQDDEMMKEIEEIVFFALPKVKGLLKDGKEIYEMIEKHLEVEPIGIHSLYPDEGYLLINEFNLKDTKIFKYQITVFENANERFRGINTVYLETIRKGVVNTYENIKLDLIKRYNSLPNPATFLINVHVPCPFEESLFPIAKRVLVKHIAQSAA